ncbi:hypothetical protein SY88_13255 [Clostridiales bacterium PH28_bin88]|nr:hypothetical protein SY88_13255 [Clostridiales bacterium PH28_bin88]
MRVIMLNGKDPYYPGEAVTVPDKAGRLLVREGLAQEVCPECGAVLVHESGCTSCYSCGFAKCG